MPDHARSSSPAVQEQLDRLWALSPGADVLGLERITILLARLGDPHLRLPPVFHVAGTNGKGSTCAFLRAALEAAGKRVHVYTSPHLCRFNERIRIAGTLIDDETLAVLLGEVLEIAEGVGASFFEVTTAAAFLAFSRTPADACVIEVGLGGRLDATNVVPAPIACGIASLGIDHESFLLAPEAGTPADPLTRIGFEKAGIAKRGVPLLTQAYPADVAAIVAHVAARNGAMLVARGDGWDAAVGGGRLSYHDHAGTLDLPLPRLAGSHQASNAALAVAMIRHQDTLAIDHGALAGGIATAHWPARLQRLGDGPLAALLPDATPLWLDGGHNPAAGEALAIALDRLVPMPRSLTLVVGMLANKDPRGFLAPLARHLANVIAVPVSDHAHHGPEDLARIAGDLGVKSTGAAPDVVAALASADPSPAVLIAGSLYLAGEVLRLNDEMPD